MLRRLHRLFASILLPLFVVQATGCTHVVKKPVAEVTPEAKDELVGITTLAGQEYKFDASGVVRDDTVRALSHDRWVIVPVDSVQRWWLRKSNPAMTGVLVGGILVATILIVSASSSGSDPAPQDTVQSCPFIYSWNGSEYVFEAEPYGGAIARGLERDDYSVLPTLASDAGRYRLLMVNELDETQMSNLVELWAIDHALDVQVLPDEWGGLHTIAAAFPAGSAVDQAGVDLTKWIARDDALIWEPAPVADSEGKLEDWVTLTFPRPAGVTQAKLVTRVGTSTWGSQMIHTVLGLRGRQVQAWYDLVDSSTAAADSVHAWALSEALYGLQLEVEGPDGWEEGAALGGSGPYLATKRVTVLDLPPAAGDSLRIRFRATRGFWAFNYFGIDYSTDAAIAVDTLRVRSGTASDGSDVVSLLSSADSLYYAMPVTGDHAALEFSAPPTRPGTVRTMLLHSRGYYHLHLDATAEGETALLQRIETVPGATAQYSAELYQRRLMASRSTR